MSICWFSIFLVLLFIELTTVNLVSVWFAIGALAAMIVSIFVDAAFVQTLVFIVVSIIALLIMKPIIRKFKLSSGEATNLDRVIGKTGEVIKKISDSEYGEVKVLGTIWTATSDETIEVGTKVIIKRIEGVKLIVEKEEK